MTAVASQITSHTIVYSTVYSSTDERKYQSSASLAFVWGIHRWPVDSPHKWPVTRKRFPFDDVIMIQIIIWSHRGQCVVVFHPDHHLFIHCQLSRIPHRGAYAESHWVCRWLSKTNRDKIRDGGRWFYNGILQGGVQFYITFVTVV